MALEGNDPDGLRHVAGGLKLAAAAVGGLAAAYTTMAAFAKPPDTPQARIDGWKKKAKELTQLSNAMFGLASAAETKATNQEVASSPTGFVAPGSLGLPNPDPFTPPLDQPGGPDTTIGSPGGEGPPLPGSDLSGGGVMGDGSLQGLPADTDVAGVSGGLAGSGGLGLAGPDSADAGPGATSATGPTGATGNNDQAGSTGEEALGLVPEGVATGIGVAAVAGAGIAASVLIANKRKRDKRDQDNGDQDKGERDDDNREDEARDGDDVEGVYQARPRERTTAG